MTFARTFELERGEIDLETGSFPATLFTDGEASDGHILSIRGATVPDRMPLFVNHEADPTAQLGSLVEPRKTEHAIKQRGVIEMQGDSPVAEIRRDVALMISRGHVTRMSGRWDAGQEDAVARTALPPEHFAHVPERSKDAKRFGLFFKRWTAQEGSIVGLGADPKAVIGRAEDVALPEHVRTFWRAFAHQQEASPTGDASLSAALSALRLARVDAITAGASEEDVFNALDLDLDGCDAFEFDGATLLLPKPLIERLRAPAPALPAAPTPAPAALGTAEILGSPEVQRALEDFYQRTKADLLDEAKRLLRARLGVVL